MVPMSAARAQAAGAPDVPEPAVPTAQGFVASSSPACSTDASAPTALGDPTPQLTAVVHLAAGSTDPGYLRAHFDIQAHQAPDTWTEAAGVLAPEPDGLVTDGQVVTNSVTDPLSEGTLYRMAASTWSYTGNADAYVASPSTASTSGWCYFTVDPTAPLAPKVTLGDPYTPCAADACAAHGGPGVPGSFTFAPGDGDTGVVGYEYQIEEGPMVQVPGSPATVSIAPRARGVSILDVRAQDATGRYGPATEVDFNVAPSAASIGLWHFDDGQPGDHSTPAADTASGTGGRHAATLSGTGADRTALGRRGSGDEALALDGATGDAETDGRVVDPAASFAVSAWVFPTDLTEDRTALSQTGGDGSGFSLGYAAADQAWQFSYTWNDADGAGHVARAEAPGGTERVWTQLAGSYDSVAHTLTLYVNGQPQGSPTGLPATAAAGSTSGDLEFGRGTTADAAQSPSAYWHGYLDEVQVWQRTLSSDDALQDARLEDPDTGSPAVANVAAWDATSASGTALTDSTTGYGRTLTTEGGARFGDDTLVLDGVDDAAGTPGPVVDGSGSFTVSVLVQPDMSAIAGKPDGWTGQVVGQRTADGSDWGVWYRLAGRTDAYDPATGDLVSVPVTQWLLGRMDDDGTFTGVTSQDATVWSPGTENDPVQVTGTFDAQAGTASLFTGYSHEGTADFGPGAGAGTGELTVGKAYLDGGWGSFFPGRVTSVSLWAGAMSDNDVILSNLG
ncbi:hypothetical protein RVR_5425 [Actinacidiphila reveromycinica]|uniref:LamG-like jellyroll fold domain-containing protein n=1 Tax=Actinacidiphila reveromycinica TaxID=659352 RepID=A0A7U3VPU7_9ACTN|nr:hypothetical protein RVR_5425 [Streptomyces sp. SN-593]